MTKHTLRDVDLGEDNTYLIEDYPVTREVLDTATVRSVSFLDDDIDSGEAFVLREVQMNAVMLVPLVVRGRSWGLVEIYDMRLRRFTSRTRRSPGSSSARRAADRGDRRAHDPEATAAVSLSVLGPNGRCAMQRRGQARGRRTPGGRPGAASDRPA